MNNDLYDMMLNLKNIDKLAEIEKIILASKTYLGPVDQKCILYSNIIYQKLSEKNIPSKIFNTKEDLNMDYEHEAVLVYDKDKYYLIDPTFIQFLPKTTTNEINLSNSSFSKALGVDNTRIFLAKGYIEVNEDEFNNYLFDIAKLDNKDCKFDTVSLDDLYFSRKKANKI